MTNELFHELMLISPLLLMAFFSILLIVVDALTGKEKYLNYVLSLGAIGIVIIFSAILLFFDDIANIEGIKEYPISMNMLFYSKYSYLFDLIFAIAAFLTIQVGRSYIVSNNAEYKEFYSIVLFATVGMMLIAHSNDLLTLFIGIELMSISFYVLAGYFRTKIASIEAGLKYFLLGAFASGFLLYGIAFIYGTFGSVQFDKIAVIISAEQYEIHYLAIGLGLIVIGLSFKIAAFPFHQWAPDVYTGAPTIVTGFMSTAGKAAAVFAFVIISMKLMQAGTESIVDTKYISRIQMIIAVLAAATMLIGNITAIAQNNIKRMLAYSSVAHAGYLLMGIVANSPDGWAGVAFYSAVYMLMQIGAFVVVALLEGEDGKYSNFEHYSGLYKKYPVVAAMMALFMFSLAGIPPFAGFFGKYYIFKSAIDAGFTWLAIVAVISSVISVYFYLKLIVYMYFKEQGGYEQKCEPKPAMFALIVTSGLIILFGLLPNKLIELAKFF